MSTRGCGCGCGGNDDDDDDGGGGGCSDGERARAYIRWIGATAAERRTTGRTRKIPGKAERSGRPGGLGRAQAHPGPGHTARRLADGSGGRPTAWVAARPRTRGVPPSHCSVPPACAGSRRRTCQVSRGKWLHVSGGGGGRAARCPEKRSCGKLVAPRRRYIYFIFLQFSENIIAIASCPVSPRVSM